MGITSETIDSLYEIVEKHTGISEEGIKGPSRKTEVVQARSVVGIILHKHTNLKLIQVGAAINRDHSIVVRNNKEHEARMQYFEGYSEMYEAVNEDFMNSLEMNIPQLIEKIALLEEEIRDRKAKIKECHKQIKTISNESSTK